MSTPNLFKARKRDAQRDHSGFTGTESNRTKNYGYKSIISRKYEPTNLLAY